ncbi:hypothetical protein DL766_002267 [Monosporascus sp. MC13-8B]|uniref:Peptidase S1 domain-containing protein n=1 Tax=Monosporascus cannonballus TaxID=155416 RepID=A0ABY0HM34_9PEZI|nr:hypothetical protein DL762_000165 [Monosporascus cannonballus]RYO97329.1 hypothetical protein DL763_002789 [Monosporascus cannonballus]RYP35866.1 hypothetical protein DL766_002267 [Monosporascus sp. MC13-8B]
MARLALQSLATALLCLTPRISASPIPEVEETTYTMPIGVPTGGFTTQFYGPTPDILTLSLEAFSISSISNVTEAPPYQPEDAELFDDPELEKRFVKGADNRVLWTNKGYPFGTMGKIQWSNGVYCSGALIGPRHVATAKHCAPLNNQGVSLRFMPGYYDGESFPGAYVTTIIHLPGYSVNDPRPDSCDIKEDWAIFILDQRLGEQRGYLGAKLVDGSVINQPRSLHLGYPGDLANGRRPYRQDRITVRNRFDCGSTGGLVTDADVAGGMSGGPIWVNENGNRYQLGVLSATSVVETVFAGGNNWLNAVIHARQNFP